MTETDPKTAPGAAPNAAPGAIRVATAADGTVTYLVSMAPEALPPVRPRDIDAAWHQARAAAIRQDWGVTRLFRFRRPDGSCSDLALADADAACWAAAVDRVADMGTPHGMSLCLRLLALVALLAEAPPGEHPPGKDHGRMPWPAGLFTLHRDGAQLSPALLRAAAAAGLDASARFDHDDLRRRLAQAHPFGVAT